MKAKRFVSFLLALCMVVGLLPGTALAISSAAAGGMGNFRRDGSYRAGTFNDVSADAWYAEGVSAAYELGLMKGSGAGAFSPQGNVTVAEAVTMASRLHQCYSGGKDDFVQGSPWYQVYVDYATTNGILSGDDFPGGYGANITRAQMAHLFAAALPETELPAVNTVDELPDVNASTPYNKDIFLLYRAGVLTGNDEQGTFTPDTPISRSQVATIIARMALPSLRKTTGAIRSLGVVRQLVKPQAVDGVEPYGDYWLSPNNKIAADLSKAPALAHSLTISDKTQFPGAPAGFDAQALLEWGKDPGLNVDILHKHGFTGKGAVVAYIDQAISDHEQYRGANVHYTNNSGENESMHGPAMLSLLAGKDIGTAPEAEIYYYTLNSGTWEMGQAAKCLYQIIEQNKSLPEGKKITMVGFSAVLDPQGENANALQAAVDACEEAGIMVWFCGEYRTSRFFPYSDKSTPQSLVAQNIYDISIVPELVYVPSGGRTAAATMGGASYIYWGYGGASGTMPYMLGLYAIAIEIDPTLTQDQLRQLIVGTAYDNNGMHLVNPVGFVSAVLDRVGRSKEADTLRAEAAARSRYLYAVMDTAAMTQADLKAVGEYLAAITNATVLVADASGFSDAKSLYAALKADAAQRDGTVAGVQIFGTPDMVPAFQVDYKALMGNGEVDDDGSFLSDIFYGNFDNDPARISDHYNVKDHFEQKWDVTLVPQWPVARLPLSKGEFTAFFDRYKTFVADTGLEQPDLVNFSNPISAHKNHSDDMGRFLERADKEFHLLDVPCRLYGNLDGQYPVTTQVLGGFTRDNLSKENDKGPMELLINSHGQRNNIDQCVFENGKEKRISFLNVDTIDNALDGNPYYLDCWTCLTGYGMTDNLTTAALNGRCVGAFSATATISGNGVNCDASLSDMAKSNFYYFYYHYLKALHEGQTRSAAFCAAQQAYGEALMKDSANGIRGEGNYQFNLYNLLTYHNFGVIEPSVVWPTFEATGYISQAGQSVPKETYQQSGQEEVPSKPAIGHTSGMSSGESSPVEATCVNRLTQGSITVHSCTVQPLDNGYVRYALNYDAPEGLNVSIYDRPSGDLFNLTMDTFRTLGIRSTLMFDIQAEYAAAASEICIKFVRGNSVSDFCVVVLPGYQK